jgi:hypothetical protein
MKVTVVVPSKEFMDSAGVRIRYQRFLEPAHNAGVSVQIAVIDDVVREASSFKRDCYIFCKTFSFEAVVLSYAMRRQGKLVGHDLFDDYFSQWGDPRLLRYRNWLSQVLLFSDFAIVGTAALEEGIRTYGRQLGVPTFIVRDPAPVFCLEDALRLADSKVSSARLNRQLRIAWFGIGDNPFFPVGIDDLASCGGYIRKFRSAGWAVELGIATNARALSAESLGYMRHMLGEFSLEQWTLEKECELLGRSTIALLPVNGQSFSRAKSLNRAITAVAHGAQILSVGYPLYSDLDALAYRDTSELADDILNGRPRVGLWQISLVQELISTLAGDAGFGEVLAALWLQHQSGGEVKQRGRMVCVHGPGSSAQIHKLVTQAGGLSVGLPYSNRNLNYHVRFELEDGVLQMFVASSLPRECFPSEVELENRETRFADTIYWRVVAGRDRSFDRLTLSDLEKSSAYSVRRLVIDHAVRECLRVIKESVCVVSEKSPVSIVGQARTEVCHA